MTRYKHERDEPCSLGSTSVIAETEKAILCEVEGEEMWIPKSVIHDYSEVYGGEGEEGELIVQGWWAQKQGIEP